MKPHLTYVQHDAVFEFPRIGSSQNAYSINCTNRLKVSKTAPLLVTNHLGTADFHEYNMASTTQTSWRVSPAAHINCVPSQRATSERKYLRVQRGE